MEKDNWEFKCDVCHQVMSRIREQKIRMDDRQTLVMRKIGSYVLWAAIATGILWLVIRKGVDLF